ncbi:DUF3325 domain-containing protein, partial [bacterium]|nr:DUF3325 domain-containing protein [bacterium]
MGGLLDKANAAKGTEEVAKEAAPEPVKVATPSPTGSTGPSGSPDTATKLSLGGWVIILLGAILSLQGGAWGFAVVSIVVVLGIGAIVQADRMRGSISKPKLYASLVVAMLVAVGPYAVVVLFPSTANIAITDISIDENNDELDFAIRGSFDSVTIEIQSDDEVLWTGTAKMTSDIKRFNVPINEFFDGNSEEFGGNIVKTYTISATSSNGNTVQLDVNSNLLVREAFNGGVQFTPYVSNTLVEGETVSNYEGIRVQAFVGLFADGEKEIDDGSHSYASSNQVPFIGQQTYTLTVSKRGSSDGYTHPMVTLDGQTASWVSDYSGAKSATTEIGFVPLSGTALDNDGFEYIEEDKFYDGDGCYDFTLSVTNVNL